MAGSPAQQATGKTGSHRLDWALGMLLLCRVSDAACETSELQPCPSVQANQCRPPSAAGRLIDEMRSGADPDMYPSALTNKQTVRLHQLLHEAKFRDPDGSHLRPAGEPPTSLIWQ